MRAKIFLLGGLILLIVASLVLKQVFIIVDEREQVIVTQFGEYIRTITNSGLAFKTPFLHSSIRFDRRILVSDAPQAEYLSQDKKRLVADPVTRWRIADPLKFFKTVRDESGARARLDDLVFSELRSEVPRKRGTNYPDCAATVPVPRGSPAPAACVCIRFYWIRAIRSVIDQSLLRRE